MKQFKVLPIIDRVKNYDIRTQLARSITLEDIERDRARHEIDLEIERFALKMMYRQIDRSHDDHASLAKYTSLTLEVLEVYLEVSPDQLDTQSVASIF